MVSSPAKTLVSLWKKVIAAVKGSASRKSDYTDMLKMLYEVFVLARRSGLIALEDHVMEPKKSALFQKYPSFLKDHERTEFLCNGLKPLIDGRIKPDQVGPLLEQEVDAEGEEADGPIHGNGGKPRLPQRPRQRAEQVRDVSEEKAADLQVTSDGLKITLFDRPQRAVFRPGSAEMTEWGTFVMQSLAWIVERNALKVYIDGHTAAGHPPRDADYGPWELTSDRANVARRALVKYAVSPAKIERVTGLCRHQAAAKDRRRRAGKRAHHAQPFGLSLSRKLGGGHRVEGSALRRTGTLDRSRRPLRARPRWLRCLPSPRCEQRNAMILYRIHDQPEILFGNPAGSGREKSFGQSEGGA